MYDPWIRVVSPGFLILTHPQFGHTGSRFRMGDGFPRLVRYWDWLHASHL